MPEYDVDTVTKEWLQSELRSPTKSLIVLDCRSSNEFQEGHIRSAVNFSIPSLILKRLASGKIDVTSTIKCRDLKQRIQNAYNDSLFVLYNETTLPASTTTSANDNSVELNTNNDATTINVLHRRLKQDGCHVYWLKDGFSSFRDAYPEWCEDDSINKDTQKSRGIGHTDQLMGLRSLRISSPYSDSACSSSAESSDCESSTHPYPAEAPVEIIDGLFLGNASHSEDLNALQKYNIKYILNVTPDLPNVFEASGTIKYLQIPITDHGSQDLSVHFPAAIKFINEARSKDAAVLVHCLAGVSRSVTVTLAYLMHERSLSLEEAFQLVRIRKPDISPNFHFLRQLHSFEGQLLDTNPDRAPLSAQSTDSSYSTPDCEKSIHSSRCGCELSSATTLSHLPHQHHQHHHHHFHHNFHQQLLNQQLYHQSHQQHQQQHQSNQQPITECKCMQTHTDCLGTGIGVSPDSGIEFDRWTPADGTPK